MTLREFIINFFNSFMGLFVEFEEEDKYKSEYKIHEQPTKPPVILQPFEDFTYEDLVGKITQ